MHAKSVSRKNSKLKDVLDMNFISIILIICLEISSLSSKRVKDDEVVKWVKNQGYKSEAYKVETKDGYILKLHRIAPKYNKGCKIPVFLMHSAFTSSFFYVSFPNISLAFFLSDEGYEVFMGNARGSKYSTHHKKYNTESSEYWRFSFHEMGLYDLPAMIDYSLMLSGSDKIFYVGHSQSTTEILTLLSLKPEYNQKVIQSHLLGTIGAYRNPPPFPKFVAVTYPLIKDVAKYLPYLNFGPGNTASAIANQFFCTKSIPLVFCQITYFVLMGGETNNILMSKIDPVVYRTFIPAFSRRSGVQQLLHFVQTADSGRFRPFDYGHKENLRVYGLEKPPDYPLDNISSAIYLYVGEKDRVFTKKDTDLLAPQLPNVHYRLISGYNHIDYLFARDAPEKIFKVMHRTFEKANKKFQNEIFHKCRK